MTEATHNPSNVSIAPDVNRRGRAAAPQRVVQPRDIERQRLVLESLDRVCKAAGINRSVAAALLGTSSSRLSQWRAFVKGNPLPQYMMTPLHMKIAIWLIGRIRDLVREGTLPLSAVEFGGRRNPKYALAIMSLVLPKDVDEIIGI